MSALPDDIGSVVAEVGVGRVWRQMSTRKVHTHHLIQYKKPQKDVWRVEIGELTGGEFPNVSDQP